MTNTRKRTRKTRLLLLGLASLTVASAIAQDVQNVKEVPEADVTIAPAIVDEPPVVERPVQQVDPASEANRAFKQAVSTLHSITVAAAAAAEASPASSLLHSVPRTPSTTPSLVWSFLPTAHGYGPLSSAIRIYQRIRSYPWLPASLSSRLAEGGRETRKARRRDEDLRGKAVKAIDLLQHAAALGHTDALYLLAKTYFLPPTRHFSANLRGAFEAYQEHAAITGNATSQAMLGFFHTTGYRGVTPRDAAKAQLYYTFGAHGGDRDAQLALAYRSWAGIGTQQNCSRAMEWYSAAAEQSMAHFLTGPPGGRTLPLTTTKLSDLAGGIYGPGASVASTGFNAHRAAVRAADSQAAGETWADIIEYYSYHAVRGQPEYEHKLAKIFYHGSLYAVPGGIASGAEGVGAVPQDYIRAYKGFMRVARLLWPKDPAHEPLKHATQAPIVKDKDSVYGSGWAALAAGYIGRMHLRGEGVPQDFAMAKMWFERGADQGNGECHNGLGILYREGLVDGKKDTKKAAVYFGLAAGHDLAEAKVNMGKMAFAQGNSQLAIQFFESAVHHGSPFEAFYYLGIIQYAIAVSGKAGEGACASAVSFFKTVAERGTWGENNLMRRAENAWTSGSTDSEDEGGGGGEQAMLLWSIAGEQGYEAAQNNLAYILDADTSLLARFRPSLAVAGQPEQPKQPTEDTSAAALAQWTRVSAQSNVDALVKVGDYYYRGLGLPDMPEGTRWEKAAGFYRAAADTHMSALAMWNLGWMYENGRGVPRDFHLAKRYYDLALETNGEAYLPVMLSLLKLYARSVWHTINGGTDGLRLWPLDDEEDELATPAHEHKKIDGAEEKQSKDRKEEDASETEDDGPWYPGKARELFDKRRGAPVDDSDDAVEWARNRRREEDERDNDYGPEDDFDGALRAARRRADAMADGGDDDDIEMLVLFGIVAAVIFLLVIRARITERLRRDEGQGQGQDPQGQGQPVPNGGQDRGLFPGPDDPARPDWAIIR